MTGPFMSNLSYFRAVDLLVSNFKPIFGQTFFVITFKVFNSHKCIWYHFKQDIIVHPNIAHILGSPNPHFEIGSLNLLASS